jgi:uncharacterized protein (TIGR02118 family)
VQKVFVMYKLKPGVDPREYVEWSKSVDQTTTPFQPGVYRFEVYQIKGRDGGDSPYDIVEDIDVESWEAWQQTVAGPGMAKVVTDWNNYGDADSLVAIYGDKVK